MRRLSARRPRIGSRFQGATTGDVILDGVGARNRRATQERSFRDRLQRDLPGALERMMDRAVDSVRSKPSREDLLERIRSKQVPELLTVDDIYELHETLQPEAPVYRVNPELLGAIGIAGVLQGTPNIEKVAANEAVGPHFDEYRLIGAEWTAWTSVLGEGALRACFLSHDLRREYALATSSVDRGEFNEDAQSLRGKIGVKAMQSALPKFVTNYTQGDTFLLWHGSLERLQ